MSTKRFCDFCGQEISDTHRVVIRHDLQMDYQLVVSRRNVGHTDSQADFHQGCALRAFIGADDGPSWPPAVATQHKEEA